MSSVMGNGPDKNKVPAVSSVTRVTDTPLTQRRNKDFTKRTLDVGVFTGSKMGGTRFKTDLWISYRDGPRSYFEIKTLLDCRTGV